MRFPLRRRVNSTPHKVRVSPTVLDLVNTEWPLATRFTRKLPIKLDRQRIERHIDDQEHVLRLRFDAHTPTNDLIMGIWFHAIAQGKAADRHPAIRFTNGVKAQAHLTAAIASLHVDDRRELLLGRVEDEFYLGLSGAKSAAKVAAHAHHIGAICYLPTAEEDAIHAIDLLIERERHGACVQVKTGRFNTVTILTSPKDETEARLFRGTALFNQKYGLSWRPVLITVGANDFDTFSPNIADGLNRVLR